MKKLRQRWARSWGRPHRPRPAGGWAAWGGVGGGLGDARRRPAVSMDQVAMFSLFSLFLLGTRDCERRRPRTHNALYDHGGGRDHPRGTSSLPERVCWAPAPLAAAWWQSPPASSPHPTYPRRREMTARPHPPSPPAALRTVEVVMDRVVHQMATTDTWGAFGLFHHYVILINVCEHILFWIPKWIGVGWGSKGGSYFIRSGIIRCSTAARGSSSPTACNIICRSRDGLVHSAAAPPIPFGHRHPRGFNRRQGPRRLCPPGR